MNNDRLKRFPNQNADHRPFECTQETVADIIGNINNQPLDPGFGYGATFHLTGQTPADSGLDPYAAFLSQCVYGSLPTAQEDFDALQYSELYEANFNNYALDDKQLAAHYAMNGVKRLNSYDEVVAYINRTGWGVGLGMRFYDSFMVPNQDGSLPAPIGRYTEHMGVTYGEEPLGLGCKWWLGPDHGVGGYTYLSKITCGLVVNSAYAFDSTQSRWWTLAKAALQYGIGNPQVIRDILPLLYAAQNH